MDMTLFIGLGNPDPELGNTYHNAGVMAVEWLAAAWAREHGESGPFEFRPYKDLFSYASLGTRTFVKPLVYMNESGRAAKEALRVFKADPSRLVVAHDDSDLTLGSFKIVRGGRAAGHKGIQSIIDHLKTEDFTRIRIGIREKDEAHRKKAGDFVLSPVSAKNRELLDEVFRNIFDTLVSDSKK